MSAAWYTDAMRWMATQVTRLADHLDTPSLPADPFEPRRELQPPDELLTETRHRLSRYY